MECRNVCDSSRVIVISFCECDAWKVDGQEDKRQGRIRVGQAQTNSGPAIRAWHLDVCNNTIWMEVSWDELCFPVL